MSALMRMGPRNLTVCRMCMRRAALMIEPDVPGWAAAGDARKHEAEHQVTGDDGLPTLDDGSVQDGRVVIGLLGFAQRFSPTGFPQPNRRDGKIPTPAVTIYHPSTYAKTNGATIVASDSMMNFGVFASSLPHVIFSFGTAPE